MAEITAATKDNSRNPVRGATFRNWDFSLDEKTAYDAALKKANEALQKQFKIEGYPTLIVLDGDGKKLGEVEFPDNTKALIASLDKLKKK